MKPHSEMAAMHEVESELETHDRAEMAAKREAERMSAEGEPSAPELASRGCDEATNAPVDDGI